MALNDDYGRVQVVSPMVACIATCRFGTRSCRGTHQPIESAVPDRVNSDDRDRVEETRTKGIVLQFGHGERRSLRLYEYIMRKNVEIEIIISFTGFTF
jgi:hypothetical protein